MPIFQPITMTFRGQEYSCPSNKVWPLLAAVEHVITMTALARAVQSGDIPVLRVAEAYAVALQQCGARVTPEEVYDEMFADGALQAHIIEAIGTLQMMMIPPERLRQKTAEMEKSEGKSAATGKTADSSPSSTSSSSVAAG